MFYMCMNLIIIHIAKKVNKNINRTAARRRSEKRFYCLVKGAKIKNLTNTKLSIMRIQCTINHILIDSSALCSLIIVSCKRDHTWIQMK